MSRGTTYRPDPEGATGGRRCRGADQEGNAAMYATEVTLEVETVLISVLVLILEQEKQE